MIARANVVMLVVVGALLTFYLMDPERRGGVGSAPQIALELFPDFEPLGADRVVVAMPDRTTELERDADQWKMMPADHPVSTERVDALLAKVATLNKGSVASRNPESFERLGVAGNNREVTIYGEGDKVLVHFYIGRRGPANRRTFVRKEGVDEVLAVLDEDLHKVFHAAPFAWFESVDVLKFDSKIATKIVLDSPSGLVRFERDDNADWVQTAPLQLAADQARVTSLARALAQLQFLDIAAPDAEDDFGFDPPVLRVEVDLADDSHHEVVAGAATPDGAQRYVKKPGEDTVYLVSTRTFDPMFLQGASAWLDDPSGAPGSAADRRFTGPAMGADLIRLILGADVLVDAVADETAVKEDGSLALEPAEGAKTVPVSFRIARVYKGSELLPGGSATEGAKITVALPANRQLPDLRPENGVHLVFLKKNDDGTFRLARDPIDSLIQPAPETRAQVEGVVAQMNAATPPAGAKEPDGGK